MKTTNRRAARIAAFGFAASMALGVQANTSVLSMDSLPNAQGWT